MHSKMYGGDVVYGVFPCAAYTISPVLYCSGMQFTQLGGKSSLYIQHERKGRVNSPNAIYQAAQS